MAIAVGSSFDGTYAGFPVDYSDFFSDVSALSQMNLKQKV
jgi:hypothetical protein